MKKRSPASSSWLAALPIALLFATFGAVEAAPYVPFNTGDSGDGGDASDASSDGPFAGDGGTALDSSTCTLSGGGSACAPDGGPGCGGNGGSGGTGGQGGGAAIALFVSGASDVTMIHGALFTGYGGAGGAGGPGGGGAPGVQGPTGADVPCGSTCGIVNSVCQPNGTPLTAGTGGTATDGGTGGTGGGGAGGSTYFYVDVRRRGRQHRARHARCERVQRHARPWWNAQRARRRPGDLVPMNESPVSSGTVIAGKYRVERVLGQGGMGVVVVAMHDELDQRVAIKFLLKNALTDGEWVARFSREAKAAARIKSEHAVKVYDVGKLADGAPYMVMEYLEGRDMQSILNDQAKLPVDEAVEYLLQACEAIAEAHSAGIVHRDLKPANLFVTHRTDGSPCVKILDFGISKMTSLTGARDQTVTNTTAIVGSPLYMSPEQMRASRNVDRRTDIWSLGVILQELVSGSPSFVANTTAELCALVLTAAPSPLELPGAPAGLADVIVKCLKKTPEERYTNVAELARALEPFGPPSVKTSVERIVRLSNTQPKAISITNEPSAVSIVPPGQSAGVAALGQTELSDSAPQPSSVAAPSTLAPAAPAGTAAAWGTSRPQIPANLLHPKMSRLPVVIATATIAAIGVLTVVFALTRPASPTPGTRAPTATTTSTSTATSTSTVTAHGDGHGDGDGTARPRPR